MSVELRKGFHRLILGVLGAYSIGLVCILAAAIAATTYHKAALAEALLLTTRNSLVVRDIRQVILNLDKAARQDFEAIGFFDSNEHEVFVIPNEANSTILAAVWPWKPVLKLPVYLDSEGKIKSGELRFAYFSGELIPYFVLIWLGSLTLAIPAVVRAKRRMILIQDEEARKQKVEALGVIASQVAHDIRSPLASLAAVAERAEGLDKDSKDLLLTAVKRIRDIADNMLKRQGSGLKHLISIEMQSGIYQSNEEFAIEPLSIWIESVVSEKISQLPKGQEIALNVKEEVFAKIQPIEFTRVVSNLLNNAIEAIPSTGTVKVSLGRIGNQVLIQFIDDGKGIPSEVLIKLGNIGETHGKARGNGLGLFHARTAVNNCNGSIDIQSKEGAGTTVTLRLPISEPPEWFAKALKISDKTTIVIMDDDDSIHQTWNMRLSGSNVLHFNNPDEVLTWYRTHLGDLGSPLFLLDHEIIGHRLTGLDLIELLGIGSSTVLVTSWTEYRSIKKKCTSLGVQLMQKCRIGTIPLI